jgi:hypothetical protein
MHSPMLEILASTFGWWLYPIVLPGEFERWNKIQQFYQSLGKMEGLVEELINNLHHQPNVAPVSCIVADTFLGWAVPLAKKLRLLSVSSGYPFLSGRRVSLCFPSLTI